MDTTLAPFEMMGRPQLRDGEWVGADGPITSARAREYFEMEAKVLGEELVFRPATLSHAMTSVNGGELTLEAAVKDIANRARSGGPSPMPSNIYTAMLLAEYFMETDGDLAQTVYAPAELGIKGLIITCPDGKVQQEARDLFYDELYLDEVLRHIYICSQVYGQAFPLEQWTSKELVGVHLLDPKSIWMDQNVEIGTSSKGMAEKLKGWGGNVVRYIQPQGDDNERGQGQAWSLDPSKVQPFFHHKFDWQYYAIPPLRTTFRSLATRQVMDELVRATFEGYINQLWVFKVGSPDRPAMPGHIRAFKSLIESAISNRTGAIVWDSLLEVEQHAPRSLDAALANQKYMELTSKIMSERGVSLRLISGTSSEREASPNMEMDVQIMIERIKVARGKLLRWCRYLIKKVGLERGWKEMPVPHFETIPMEDQIKIRMKVVPMYQAGPLSAKTALTEAGYNYEEEMANKAAEDKEMLMPPVTYAQAVVTPGGAEERNRRPGRPDGAEDSEPRIPIEAAYEKESPWAILMVPQWQKLERKESTPAAFIAWMLTMNEVYAKEVFLEGYADAGGNMAPDPEAMAAAIAFNAMYLAEFQKVLEGATDYRPYGYRPALYNDHGRRIAYMYGIFQAMKEHGVKGWQRVLHPELSVSGPCAECEADAKVVHDMSEPFFDHPHGVCSMQEVMFFDDSGNRTVYPVPRRKEERDLYVRRSGSSIGV